MSTVEHIKHVRQRIEEAVEQVASDEDGVFAVKVFVLMQTEDQRNVIISTGLSGEEEAEKILDHEITGIMSGSKVKLEEDLLEQWEKPKN